MKRTAKHYKQEMEKLRVAISKAKKENVDLRQYVNMLHRAVTSKEFMVFLRMREEANGTGDMRISTPESPDYPLLDWVLAGEWIRQVPTIISIGWKEITKDMSPHKIDASFAVLGDKHVLKFKSYFSLDKGMEKSKTAASVANKQLEVTYG